MSIVGVISDTHGLLRDEAISALAGADHILHAGDIGKPEVITRLRQIAPVSAVRGNIDQADWAREHPESEMVQIEQTFFYMVHRIDDLDLDPVSAGVQVVVSGHSHKPAISHRDGVLYLNPGSAGPRRFSLPVCVARVDVEADRPRAEITYLYI